MNFIHLNSNFPEYPFRLETLRELLHQYHEFHYKVFNFDVTKAYYTMMLNPKSRPDFGIWVWFRGKWRVVQAFVPLFGVNYYPRLYNAKLKTELNFLRRLQLSVHTNYDNGMIFINSKIWADHFHTELLDFLCYNFIKLQTPLNSDYGYKFTHLTKFLGEYIDFSKHVSLPSVRRFRKFISLVHRILISRKLSCDDASKIAGIFQSMSAHPINRAVARVFYNFLTKHTPTLDWRLARKFRSSAWTKSRALPEHIFSVLAMWSDLIYTPSFLKATWTTQTIAHFEFISDANPQYQAVTFWKNHIFVARSVHITAPNTHSYEFELQGFQNALAHFSASLLRFSPASIAVTFWCDNQATCRHVNSGARQFAQNEAAFKIIHFFATHEIRFIARWKHRSTAQITEVDTAGHLPTVEHFFTNLDFFSHLCSVFPGRKFQFLLREHAQFSRLLSHFSQFWTRFSSWDFLSSIPILGPLFDNNFCTFLIPKILASSFPILFLVPKFENCMFYQSLLTHCVRAPLPFALISSIFKPGLLRYPLELHLYEPQA